MMTILLMGIVKIQINYGITQLRPIHYVGTYAVSIAAGYTYYNL